MKTNVWLLLDQLQIRDAALLALGHDPEDWQDLDDDPGRRPPPGYRPMVSAIFGALAAREIRGRTAAFMKEGDIPDDLPTSPEHSFVEADSLRQWLAARDAGLASIFDQGPQQPGYLDPLHPRYSVKLAAAVAAWNALDGFDPDGGLTPKQAAVEYLEYHAAELGLSDAKGKVNERTVDDIAKIVNWQPGGGAPRTPG